MLLDTSGLLCYHSKDEPEHKEAQHLFKSERHHLTHSYLWRTENRVSHCNVQY